MRGGWDGGAVERRRGMGAGGLVNRGGGERMAGRAQWQRKLTDIMKSIAVKINTL